MGNVRLRIALGATLILLAAAPPARAGGGPENVFLVVNARGPKSREVANHYIALRRVPAHNVFYLPAPPNATRMTGLDFREKILRPVLAEIDRRGLRPHIDQIVYSCDFPWQIDLAGLLGLPATQGPARPIASLTGATYLYQFMEEASKNMVALNTNFYFASPGGSPTVTRAFRGSYQWAPNGSRVESGGMRYLLATQLGCSQPEANSVPEMIAYLTRSAAADGTRPGGTFYYMQNENVRSKARDPGFPLAVQEIRSLGLKAEVANGVVPAASDAMLGLTTGSPHVHLQTSRAKLAPGALVDNLTSQGGVLTRPSGPKPQTRITEYMRLGAGGASGTVVEPYAIAAKFPAPSLHVHYARGATMAEAFYQSVAGPFQLLILGDPLCQPWAMIPTVTVSGVAAGQQVSGAVVITPEAKAFKNRAIARFEIYVDGRPQGPRFPGQAFELDTTKLADGPHEVRVVAIDDSPIETQGRWIGTVTVKNGHDAVSLLSPMGRRVSGEQVALSVNGTLDAVTAVYHNEREVGRVKGRRGTVQIPLEKLGRGPVTLVARTVGTPGVCSPPLELDVH